MADVRQVNADLVFATRIEAQTEQRKELRVAMSRGPQAPRIEHRTLNLELRTVNGKPALDPILGPSGRSIGTNAVLNRDAAVGVFAERRRDGRMILKNVAVHDGQVFF